MEPGLIVAFSAIGGNLLIGIGLAFTWQRNGKAAATGYGELKEEVANTSTTVKEIDRKVDSLLVNSGRLDERVHAAERDIKELKQK